jgi:hypothetical protein
VSTHRTSTPSRLVSTSLALVLALAAPTSMAWDTFVGSGTVDLAWEAAYVGNPQAGSLPASGWSGNEHTELAHVVLKELGVDSVFGMEPVGTSDTTVVDLNSALYQPQVLAEEKFGDNPMTLLEERVVPPPAHFAGLPDYSYAMHDWVNKNTHCPLEPGTERIEECHLFAGWMGNLNANHFGTQARNMYRRYHLLALNLAGRAKTMREALAAGALDSDAEAYASFVKEAELEALAYEAIGQHFLQDRWATGHMWERWNGADQASSAGYHLAFLVAMAAGLLHGSEGVSKLPDPMGSPLVVGSGGSSQALPVRWRIPGLPTEPGVGDYRLTDMHDGLFGAEYGLPQMPIAVTQQKMRMYACSKAGWSEVIKAFGEISPGRYGEHDVTLAGGPFPPILEDDDCWSAYATNAAIASGWLTHPSASNIRLEARTLADIRNAVGIVEARERVTPLLETTWRVAARLAVSDPDSTFLARGGIGSFTVSSLSGPLVEVKVGKGFPVPRYAEPQNLAGLLPTDPQGRGRDLHALYGFFNRSHADWWCQNLQSEIAPLRGSSSTIQREACSYIANRAYKATDPTYHGDSSEGRSFMGSDSDPICKYYGVETASVNDAVPYFLHPGYVADPDAQGKHGYKTIEHWCAKVAVIDRMMCPGPEPAAGDDRWDVVGRAFENGGQVTIQGRNFGATAGTLKTGSVEDAFPITLQTGSWSDTAIQFTIPPDQLTAGDWFLQVCPFGDATRCSVGRFILRVGEDGPSFLRSSFDSDVENWTHTGAASFSFGAGGGNPGGYLHVDNSEGDLTFVFANAAYIGNLSAMNGGTISFDGNMLGVGGLDYNNPIEDYGNIRITGGGTSARADLLPGTHTGNGVGSPPKNQWTTFSMPLTAAAFGVAPATWASILANVTEVRLSVEALFGEEVHGVDNFTMAGTPGDLCSQVP